MLENHLRFLMKILRFMPPLVGLNLFLALSGLGLRADPPPPTNPAGPVVIITHVDVMPPFTASALAVLRDYREDSRRDTGAERVDVLQQIGRPNHFTLVEEWANQNAYDQHVCAAHTVRFRARLQPMLGAPFDERPHSIVGLK
jgi:quinol monooxygenase YgiN